MVEPPSAKVPVNRWEKPGTSRLQRHAFSSIRRLVDPEDAARVEVVHRHRRAHVGSRCVAGVVVDAVGVGPTDDGERVGEVRMVGDSADDQESSAFEPLDCRGPADDHTGHGGMRGRSRPGANQSVELFELGIVTHCGPLCDDRTPRGSRQHPVGAGKSACTPAATARPSADRSDRRTSGACSSRGDTRTCSFQLKAVIASRIHAGNVYRFAPEAEPTGRAKVNVEINTREHEHLYGVRTYPFAVANSWFTGQTSVVVRTRGVVRDEAPRASSTAEGP